MRTLCDVCESAAATLFCAADEAALCPACDDKVHLCNKLASRHVRVGLAVPNEVPRCDICENAPAFFYCEVDGSSLCLQCDMIVHVGGKRTHRRYLLLRQRIQFPGDKATPVEVLDSGGVKSERNEPPPNSSRVSPVPILEAKKEGQRKRDAKMIDLNSKPSRIYGQASRNNQGLDGMNGTSHESASVVPDGYFGRDGERIELN
ncbi:hypothetical protein ACHQM5_024734 [Ranunculus cassubicifolius]